MAAHSFDSAIVDAIAARGYAIIRGFVPAGDVIALRAAARAYDRAGDLAPAGVGRGTQRAVRGEVRGDRIRWIDSSTTAAPEQRLLAACDGLRVALNRELQLGLLDFEAHYALYPAGARYARHVDRFHDDAARALSLVLYLNDAWRPEEGGALRLFVGDGHIDVSPEGGTLVAFLSERFAHEVRAASRERVSVAGWFRRRA